MLVTYELKFIIFTLCGAIQVGCGGAALSRDSASDTDFEDQTSSIGLAGRHAYTIAGMTTADPREVELPVCGTVYAPPLLILSNYVPRLCAAQSARTYLPRYRTLAHRILDIESELCGVPDSAYRLLDDLISDAEARNWGPMPSDLEDRFVFAARVSKEIDRLMVDAGFLLYVPIATLGDALSPMVTIPSIRYLADCDTSSFIYLAIGEHLGLPISMVEIRYPSGGGHNYVRWQLDATTVLDFDTNGRDTCRTPADVPAWQGRTLTPDAVLSYVLHIRADRYAVNGRPESALADLLQSTRLDPQHPGPLDSLARLIATHDEFQSPNLQRRALDAARRAYEINPTPNVFDTLMCALAASGDFAAAEAAAAEALESANGHSRWSVQERLSRFRNLENCVGEY